MKLCRQFYARRTNRNDRQALPFPFHKDKSALRRFHPCYRRRTSGGLLQNLHRRDRTLPPNKCNTHRVQNPVGIYVFLPVFCPGKHCKHRSEKICPCRFCRLEKKTLVTFHAFIIFTDFVILDVS